jgi:hypothetical protein
MTGGFRADEGPARLPPNAASLVSPAQATLVGWLAVALWNAGDIARLTLQNGGVPARLAHHAIDLGHVLAVALASAAGVGLWLRLGHRREPWGSAGVAISAGALGPLVLSDDLAGALERTLPEYSGMGLLPLACVAVSQGVTVAFVVGRALARPILRWFGVAAGVALVVANDFVLENGYPGAHVLLSASGATLVAAALSGAARMRRGGAPRWFERTSRRVVAAAPAAAIVAATTVVLPAPNDVQLELLERDTPLLSPWLRSLYPPKESGDVTIPRELRPWFENRAERPDIPPAPERFLGKGPIVVLLTIDALRTDVLEPRRRRTARNLHEIRKNSVYFAQARSSASDTRYSMATLFSGMHGSMLNWTARGPLLTLERDRHPRLPELLREGGVDTATVRTVTMLDPRQGIARGFGKSLRRARSDDGGRVTSDEVASAIIDRLRKHGRGPLFVYTHLMDPHAPYETRGKRVKSEFEAYLLEVSVADAAVGRIREAIRELGLAHRTALIIGSDHGEGFGEHRLFTHGKAFYDVMVHVPLMVELPGVEPRTVNDFVSLMDVGPTVLDLFGLPTPGAWMGETLTPFLAGRRGPPGRPVLMEKPGQSAMLFADGLKVMKRRGAYELYDVLRDPGEHENLWNERGEEGPRRLALLEAYVRAHAPAKRSSFDRGD